MRQERHRVATWSAHRRPLLALGMASSLAVVATAGRIPAQEPATGSAVSYEGPEAYVGRAFLFEADLASGIELGWLEPRAPREATLEAMRVSLEQRLRRSGKFVEGVVTREPGDRFAVTFVGKQSPGFEALLTAGMAAAGRFSLHVAATDADLAACGSTLTRETRRLERWRRETTTATLASFNRLPRPGGGPCPSIAWLPRWRGRDESDVPATASPAAAAGSAAAVLRQPQHLLRAVDLRLLKVVPLADREPPVLDLTFHEPALEELRRFQRETGGRTVLFAVDGRVVGEQSLSEPVDNPLRLDGGFAVEELLPLVLAFAGEPLPAPLRFVRREPRELPNVRERDSPAAID